MYLTLNHAQVRSLSHCKQATSRVLIVLASFADNEVIHKEQILRVANVTPQVYDNAIKELIQHKILFEHENGIDYVLNNRAFCIG